MTRDEHKALIARVIERASETDLCDVAVIGIRPDGGGLYLDWSGTTVTSLILHLAAAHHTAVRAFVDGVEGKLLDGDA